MLKNRHLSNEASNALHEDRNAAYKSKMQRKMEMLKLATKADNIKAWNFYHGNARGNLVAMKYFRETFPITHNDWDYLTREYLLKSYPDVCTPS